MQTPPIRGTRAKHRKSTSACTSYVYYSYTVHVQSAQRDLRVDAARHVDCLLVVTVTAISSLSNLISNLETGASYHHAPLASGAAYGDGVRHGYGCRYKCDACRTWRVWRRRRRRGRQQLAANSYEKRETSTRMNRRESSSRSSSCRVRAVHCRCRCGCNRALSRITHLFVSPTRSCAVCSVHNDDTAIEMSRVRSCPLTCYCRSPAAVLSSLFKDRREVTDERTKTSKQMLALQRCFHYTAHLCIVLHQVHCRARS